jgi:hypothetical protein
MQLRTSRLAAAALVAGLGLFTTGAAHAEELDHTAPPTREPVQEIAFESTSLPPLQFLRPRPVDVGSYTCPEEQPWLLDRSFQMRDDIPRGVEIEHGRLVQLNIQGEPQVDEATGYVTGWLPGGNTAANWHVSDPSFATVTAHCTSDADRAYAVPDAAPRGR